MYKEYIPMFGTYMMAYTQIMYIYIYYTHPYTYLFTQWNPQASKNTDLTMSGCSIIVLKSQNKFSRSA